QWARARSFASPDSTQRRPRVCPDCPASQRSICAGSSALSRGLGDGSPWCARGRAAPYASLRPRQRRRYSGDRPALRNQPARTTADEALLPVLCRIDRAAGLVVDDIFDLSGGGVVEPALVELHVRRIALIRLVAPNRVFSLCHVTELV